MTFYEFFNSILEGTFSVFNTTLFRLSLGSGAIIDVSYFSVCSAFVVLVVAFGFLIPRRT